MFLAFERRFDSRDLVVARREGGGRAPLAALADLAQSRQDVRFEHRELLLAHLAELDAHLGRQQLLAQRRVVVELGVDRGSDFIEDEADAADEERVEEEQGASEPFRA